MTFSDIVEEVADRLNLSSDKAFARIGRSVNERYRALASSIGLPEVARGTVTASSVIGSSTVTFAAQKLYSVFDATVTPIRVLGVVSFDTLRNTMLVTDPPTAYAIKSTTSATVSITLNVVAATIYVLTADADINLTSLAGVQVPAFAENFHDCLVYGAMATELDKMEKYDLAVVQNTRYENRVSDLRLYNAKSAYQIIHQGARRTSLTATN